MRYKSRKITWEVNENECHICTSHKPSKGGYPQYTVNNKTEPMSRYLFKQKYGQLSKGLCVCHTCDNRMCININHFFLGTKGDNNLDRKNKNRTARFPGEKNPKNKLTESQIKEIRAIKGLTHKQIAKMYGITRGHVTNIKRMYNWKCIMEVSNG